jgi:hypothetical protein
VKEWVGDSAPSQPAGASPRAANVANKAKAWSPLVATLVAQWNSWSGEIGEREARAHKRRPVAKLWGVDILCKGNVRSSYNRRLLREVRFPPVHRTDPEGRLSVDFNRRQAVGERPLFARSGRLGFDVQST